MAFEDVFEYFDAIKVINLDRRSERWKSFLARLPKNWPFHPPVRYSAVDGTKTNPPSNWHSSCGAWGCYQSHLSVIQQAIDSKWRSILILEDDATFSPNFFGEVRKFIAFLPDDWELIYLGGQHIELHLGRPERVNEWVYRPFNSNRTHAYAIQGHETLKRIHAFLSAQQNWTDLHHVDHFLGAYQKSGQVKAYVPKSWLVAQSGGDSDVANEATQFRTFISAEDIANPRIAIPMVAILGPYGEVSSTVAGILHHLGISMGSTFEEQSAARPFGNYQASELARSCRHLFIEPWLTENGESSERTELLRIWGAIHTQACANRCTLAGGIHPLFCLMGHELVEAWNQPFFISVEQDQQDIVNSFAHQYPQWPLEAYILVTQQLIACREAFLASSCVPVLRLDYEAVVADKMGAIDAICKFLNYQPTEDAIKRALSSMER